MPVSWAIVFDRSLWSDCLLRRNLAIEGWETLRELEAAGDLRIEGRRILPPGRRCRSFPSVIA